MRAPGRTNASIVSANLLRWMVPLLLLLAMPLAASDRQVKEAELKQLRERIVELQQQLRQVRGRHDSLREELRVSEQRIGDLNATIRRLDGELDERERRMQGLRGEEQELQQILVEQREQLAGQVRAAYAMGRQEYLKILLNQQDPATVGRMITYYDYLNRARSERISTLSDTIHSLEQVRSALAEESRRLKATRSQRAAEVEALERSREERNRLVQRLRQEISTKDQRLSGMQRDERELKALIRALADALADIPDEPGDRQPFAKLRGKLAWPARGPILASFGSSRKLGKLNWNGVMIGAGAGDEVKAVSHGRVAFADWLRGYGLLLIIDHGDGYMSLYGHNQSLYKEVGDWVERGEAIASVGDSGGLERAGLYFEIRQGGRPIDPVRWVKR